MSRHERTKTILYERRTDKSTIRCQVAIFPDNSAYVSGDELEVIFESSSDAIQHAIEYVESRGYVKAVPGGG